MIDWPNNRRHSIRLFVIHFIAFKADNFENNI